MNLDDPIAIYDAKSNIEAIQVAQYLNAEGLRAHAVEDYSLVGQWAFGMLPQVHRPQVWVGRKDSEEAEELVTEFDKKKFCRNVKRKTDNTEFIAVECEECGKSPTYNPELDGTVQECTFCHSYVDVGEFDWEGQDFGEPEDE